MTAGVAVLIAMATIGIALLPPYLANMKFQQYIEQVVRDPAANESAAELLRIQIARHAQSSGLPVRSDQIRVRKAEGRTAVEVRYSVRMDFPLYTVDLHFRPRAGGR